MRLVHGLHLRIVLVLHHVGLLVHLPPIDGETGVNPEVTEVTMNVTGRTKLVIMINETAATGIVPDIVSVRIGHGVIGIIGQTKRDRLETTIVDLVEKNDDEKKHVSLTSECIPWPRISKCDVSHRHVG